MTATASPRRPPAVPHDAVFDAEQGHWRVASPDAAGPESGRLRTFREDGTLLLETPLVAGKPHGVFRRYSRSGHLAREGTYNDGAIDGVVTCHAPQQPSDEPLRGCCVPVGAVRMDARYAAGQLMRETFFDAQGRALQSSGTPRPERPPNLAASAEFDESSQRFYVGESDPANGAAMGTWRYFRLDGSLSEELDFAAGRKIGQRSFDLDGNLIEQIAFLPRAADDSDYHDVRHGPWSRRFLPDENPPFALPGVAQVRGAFDHDESVDIWTLLGEARAPLAHFDLGRLLGDTVVDAELLGPRAEATHWDERAAHWRHQGRLRESLLATARAAATRGSAEGLRAALAASVLPLAPVEAAALAQTTLDGEIHGARELLNALVRGGDPAPLLRAISVAIGGLGEGPLDLVNAAALLAPERAEIVLSRALLHLERGAFAAVAADAERLRERAPDTTAFLTTYLRLLSPPFDFQPARDPPPELPEDVEIEIAQPLEAVQRAFAVYATRLRQVRAALLALCPGAPSWLPPDPSPWLPGGGAELRKFEADILDEANEPPPGEANGQSPNDDDASVALRPGETLTHVTVDETLDTAGLGVPSLMRLARAQWAALAFLCWSAGQDHVAPPTAIASHPHFARALAMAMERAFRARDALVTGGLRSQTRGVPGFSWEGLDIDEMERPFAELCAYEYLEIRAALLFLASAGNLSPFQDDLRRV